MIQDSAHRDETRTMRFGIEGIPGLVGVFVQENHLRPALRNLLCNVYDGCRGPTLLSTLGISEVQLRALEQEFVLHTGRSVYVAARELRSVVDR